MGKTHKTSKRQRLIDIRFARAADKAYEVLNSVNNPNPPIPVLEIAKTLELEVEYGPCYGLAGYTYKQNVGNGHFLRILIATDFEYKTRSFITRRRHKIWTLAHEIGHALLHDDIMWNTDNQKNLSDEESDALEVEAHWFASRLLLPDYVFESVDDLHPPLLMNKCNVNYTSATKRINTLQKEILHRLIGDVPVERVRAESRSYVLIGARTFLCFVCGCESTEKILPDFCPVCGSRDTYGPGGDDETMIYKGFELDKEGRARTCPQCENEEVSGQYCKVCSVNVVNRCTNVDNNFGPECGALADGNARYCIHCGSKTTFFADGLLKDWQEERGQQVAATVKKSPLYEDDPFASDEVPNISEDDIPF